MLQMIQSKVQKEGEQEEALYNKFQCYCKTGGAGLAKSVEDATDKITQLQADIEAGQETKAQLVQDLTQHKKDRAEAKKAAQEAKGIREKEAAEFDSEKSELDSQIKALAKAIKALEDGMGGSFLQTPAAAVLKKLSMTADIIEADRDIVTSFLTQGQSSEAGYAPQSNEIVGVLKAMQDTMEKLVKEATDQETEAIENFQALVAAKAKEIQALQTAIEAKTSRQGEVSVNLVTMSEDLTDTETSLGSDKTFLNNLGKDCDSKKKTFEENSKMRSEELLTIADTIKVLNDDDALDLFKKTLPSASFLQTRVSSKEVLTAARRALRQASHASRGGKRDFRLDLISMALHHGSRNGGVNFGKVITMIDNMISVLNKEQADDETKKAYCLKEIDTTEDTKKDLDRSQADLAKTIEEKKGSIEQVTEEIATLVQGIKDLDKAVTGATEQRKEENVAFKEEQASNNAATELLTMARKRLIKFYAPKLAEPDFIQVNNGVQQEPEALVQIHARRVEAASKAHGVPPPPPETMEAYNTKSKESEGVVSLIDTLIATLKKEGTEMEVEEGLAQKDYETLMQDSADKRANDSASVAEKEEAKADLEAMLQRHSEELKSTKQEGFANLKYLMNLHQECDWLIQNFQVRQEARAGELDSLKQGKAVLSGADYAFVQTAESRNLMRAGRR